jgi:hypothetical protein
MKGRNVKQDIPEMSETKRALLEKYLRGEIEQTQKAMNIVTISAGVELVGSRERVVAIQNVGSKRPFFFLHGQWEHKAFFCYQLARDL